MIKTTKYFGIPKLVQQNKKKSVSNDTLNRPPDNNDNDDDDNERRQITRFSTQIRLCTEIDREKKFS